MRSGIAVQAHGQIQHLVEVAIVQVTPPVHAEVRLAHHIIEIRVTMSVAQESHVALKLSLGLQHAAKAPYGKVCQR